MLSKALHLLERVLRSVLAALMAGLVVSVSWQVLSRYVMAAPSSWTEEAARFLMIWIGVLGATYAYRQRLHLAIDLLPKRMGAVAGARLEMLNAGCVAAFALTAMLIGGGRLVMMTWELEQISPALGIPMAAVYEVVPISGALLLLFAGIRVTEEHAVSTRGPSARQHQ